MKNSKSEKKVSVEKKEVSKENFSLPYYNEDFKKGINFDKKRGFFLKYLLITPLKDKEILDIPKILSLNPKIKNSEDKSFLARGLERKINNYFSNSPKKISIRLNTIDKSIEVSRLVVSIKK
jgi:hypothetical protein